MPIKAYCEVFTRYLIESDTPLRGSVVRVSVAGMTQFEPDLGLIWDHCFRLYPHLEEVCRSLRVSEGVPANEPFRLEFSDDRDVVTHTTARDTGELRRIGDYISQVLPPMIRLTLGLYECPRCDHTEESDQAGICPNNFSNRRNPELVVKLSCETIHKFTMLFAGRAITLHSNIRSLSAGLDVIFI